ncbi:hypothetical protein [Bradyrhizobium sp. AUGA SZCCT0431]|uniref:hypothetical protein n=1 Tax=Bradyrhizobium sp. AUGA SZCCT0431 TaxID=2807674 RepID=UPI001BAE4AA3|nr:hypothetical protein [Bradyrhizobium sp. AUGA SZCCT0431]MBR1147500.1 hypothetical protein [Bradyrhizobium sp. AUGA SZCCT0431]
MANFSVLRSALLNPNNANPKSNSRQNLRQPRRVYWRALQRFELKNRADVKLETSPRMADFAVAITAAEEGLGWEPGTFIAAYEANLELAMIDLTSQDPLIEAISKCLATHEGLIVEPATELLRLLEKSVPVEEARKRNWPKQPNQLTRSLRRLAPVMRSMGIEVELDFERDKETNIKRIRITSPRPTM